MFGYVKPFIPELRVREYEYYKAVYCGLCRAMKKTTGFFSSFTLNYDTVFLVLIRLLYDEGSITFIKKRCPSHPFRTHKEACVTASFTEGARVSALLTAAKNRDDRNDESGFRRLRAYLCMPFLSYAEKRAAMPELRKKLASDVSELSLAEKKGTASIDRLAEYSGKLLSDVFSAVCGENSRAAEIGRIVGRVIYKCDALDDYSEDLKRHRFNPYFSVYGRHLTEEYITEITRSIRMELCILEEHISALPLGKDPEILSVIDNILYIGLCPKDKAAEKQTRKEIQ